ncbi:hypothetical protein BH10BAC4_BH10BAC4_06810 [soil metagenome]
MKKCLQLLTSYSSMKTLALILLFTFPAILISCSKADTLDKRLVGKWTMEKVYEYGEDLTAKHDSRDNRYIKFNSDGTFISDGDPGRNTGRWRTDNEKMILYIDSDVEDDDSEWNVTFNGDETIWTGIGHPRKENTKLVHKRE